MTLEHGRKYFLKTYDKDGIVNPISKWINVTCVGIGRTAKLIDCQGKYWNEWMERPQDIVDYDMIVK